MTYEQAKERCAIREAQTSICPHLLDQVYVGDALRLTRLLPDESINCIITSPPYWGLRDYGVEGQWGLEPTPEEYVERLVVLFRELRRVLRADGTCWLNLGDCYITVPHGPKGANAADKKSGVRKRVAGSQANRNPVPGLKHKDLVMLPHRCAIALQADGWWVRQDNVWSKPNPMPESVKDRCTKAHEYVFLLTKATKYYYDHEAIKEPAVGCSGAAASFKRKHSKRAIPIPGQTKGTHREDRSDVEYDGANGRNKRSVWVIPTRPYKGSHYATFPPDLPETCIKAGCPVGGIVLDPFVGSGTTVMVARRLGRRWIGFDLDPRNLKLVAERISK